MGAGGDFCQFCVDEVTWTMLDAGAEIRGAAAVRDYVTALHAQMSDVHTRRIVVSDNAAYLEGDCVNAQNEDTPRIVYCRLRRERRPDHGDALLRHVRRDHQPNTAR